MNPRTRISSGFTSHEDFQYLPPALKAKPLDNIVDLVLDDIGLPYQDLTGNCNFKDKIELEHSEADFLIPNFAVIENKNFECYRNRGYTVTVAKVTAKILPKFYNYMNYPVKLLIISNPKWGKGAKELILSHGIKIIEIGYQITFDSNVAYNGYLNLKSKMFSLLGLASSRLCTNEYRISIVRDLLSSLLGKSSTLVGFFEQFFDWFKRKIWIKSNLTMSFKNKCGFRSRWIERQKSEVSKYVSSIIVPP